MYVKLATISLSLALTSIYLLKSMTEFMESSKQETTEMSTDQYNSEAAMEKSDKEEDYPNQNINSDNSVETLSDQDIDKQKVIYSDSSEEFKPVRGCIMPQMSINKKKLGKRYHDKLNLNGKINSPRTPKVKIRSKMTDDPLCISFDDDKTLSKKDVLDNCVQLETNMVDSIKQIIELSNSIIQSDSLSQTTPIDDLKEKISEINGIVSKDNIKKLSEEDNCYTGC